MRGGYLKQYAEFFNFLVRSTDLAMIVAAALIAHMMCFGDFTVPTHWQILIITAVAVAGMSFPAFGLYRPWRGLSVWAEIRAVSLAWLSLATTFAVLVYLTKTGATFSRLWIGLWVLSTLCLLIASRIVIRHTLRWLRRNGYNTRCAVILGAGRLGRRVAEQLTKASWTGLKVTAFFDDNPRLRGKAIDGIPICGPLDDVKGFIENGSLSASLQAQCRYPQHRRAHPSRNDIQPSCTQIDQVWVTLPLAAEKRVKQVLAELSQSTVQIHFVPDIFGFQLFNHSVDEIAGIPVLNLSASPMVGNNRLIKALEDRVLAALFLLMASPLMLLIAIGIKLRSPGPVLFKQRRYGLDGTEFAVWKFRTMTVCEDGPSVPQARKNDPRVTKFGALLRSTSLDELPQLINVLQGSMSMVGPRPHAVAHNEQYRKLIKSYMLRHKVKPGITGWAQVNGWRGETDTFEKMKKRVEYDFAYISNWSLWLDIKIIFLTIIKGFVNENAY
ncbi:MAG: undecaprenyl-phosphate glucose phosphotransferase [Gammaproteobacteria bacterium]